MVELANEKTNEENIHLFKKVGSNFLIKDRTVLFEPRSAWRTLSDSGFFGGNSEQTALCADHIFASEPDFVFWRWGWDSNPRGHCGPTGFQDQLLKPLGHPTRLA